MDEIDFQLVRKKGVRNYTIRVGADGRVVVTVPWRGSRREAEDFVRSRAGWIARKQREAAKKTVLDPEDLAFGEEDRQALTALAEEIFPRFSSYEIGFPELKFRVMRSCWGNCRKERGIVTLNKLLVCLPGDLREYVICHELSHLVVPDHSRAFYQVLTGVLPDRAEREARIRDYTIKRSRNHG